MALTAAQSTRRSGPNRYKSSSRKSSAKVIGTHTRVLQVVEPAVGVEVGLAEHDLVGRQLELRAGVHDEPSQRLLHLLGHRAVVDDRHQERLLHQLEVEDILVLVLLHADELRLGSLGARGVGERGDALLPRHARDDEIGRGGAARAGLFAIALGEALADANILLTLGHEVQLEVHEDLGPVLAQDRVQDAELDLVLQVLLDRGLLAQQLQVRRLDDSEGRSSAGEPQRDE